jgi:hypothetical protein
MVAVSDFGCGVRERMVRVAIEHGWIATLANGMAARGVVEPVVVLVENTTEGFAGRFHRFAGGAGAFDAMPHAMRDVQRENGCPHFLLLPLPLADVEPLLSADGARDLRDALDVHEWAVLCVNADPVAFVAGISPNETEG